jgi:FMN-dependent NADH-azoreductase
MNLLHIDSSVLGNNSVSRTLSAAAVARFKQLLPGLSVTYRDLAADPLSHLTGAHVAAIRTLEAPSDPEIQADLVQGAEVLNEFLAADIVVIGFGLYNFTIPSQLKSWVDRIAIAGKTFRYSEKGPVGLMAGKRAVFAIGRGGFYGPGMPAQAFEHGESYLRSVFGFLGIQHLEVIVAEGVAVSPQHRETSINAALVRVATLEVST